MITEFYHKNDIKGIELFAFLMFGDRFRSGHAKKFKGLDNYDFIKYN
jgi:hypothetical protein